MASITRQPFAPLNEARLHTLTSLKNRQNAIPGSSPTKRKASDTTASENLENVDPVSASKRARGADGFFPTKDTFIKPPTFLLSKSASASELPIANAHHIASPRPRSLLNPKSPGAKLNASSARSSPLSGAAGRPLGRKRSGGLLSSRKRAAGSYMRVDPPVFSHLASSVAPFSLDAALRGTIPSYTSRDDVSSSKKQSSSVSEFGGLHEPEAKSSWFFDIHEDTEAEEVANMLQHGACTLDISSDEESEKRRQRERAEGKENLPPVDDVSQTSHPRATRHSPGVDEMMIEKERSPLGEMDPKQYYSKGCDENSIVIVPGDEDDEIPAQNEIQLASEGSHSADIGEPPLAEEKRPASVEELMQKTDNSAPSATLLQPLEGTDETFEVWESSSAKDEAEPAEECC